MHREKNKGFPILILTRCVELKEEFNLSVLKKYEIYLKEYPKDYEIQIKFNQFMYFKLRKYVKALINCK